jgi:hypothetical protein
LSLPLTLYYVSESSEQIRQEAMSGCCQLRAEKKLGAAYQKQTAYSLRALKSSKIKLARSGWCAFTMKKILASRDDYRPSGNQHVTQLLLQNYLLTCVITTGCRTFFPSSRCPPCAAISPRVRNRYTTFPTYVFV